MSVIPGFSISGEDVLLAFHRALADVREVLRTKEADTGRYTYRYADLGDVLDECKRALAEQGLQSTQIPTAQEVAGMAMLAVHLVLFHRSGQSMMFEPLMMKLPSEAQAYGSALTYARRYQLLTIFEIAPEDDDGAAATTSEQTQPGRRTEAERMIRESIGQMDEAMRTRFTAAFKSQFGSNLTDLPAARHGDALTWSRTWQREDEADQEFVNAAREAEGAGASPS